MSSTTNDVANGERVRPDRSPTGTNVLLLGPSVRGGSTGHCHRPELVDSWEDTTVIYVLLTRSHANHVERRVEWEGDVQDIVVIDAVPDTGWSDASRIDGIQSEQVSSPSNLTEIGIALNRYLPTTEGERAVVCVRSLTALLQYVDVKGAYRFLNVLTNRVATRDVQAHYHLDPMAHEDRVVFTLASLFDDVVEADSSESGLRDDSNPSNRLDTRRGS